MSDRSPRSPRSPHVDFRSKQLAHYEVMQRRLEIGAVSAPPTPSLPAMARLEGAIEALKALLELQPEFRVSCPECNHVSELASFLQHMPKVIGARRSCASASSTRSNMSDRSFASSASARPRGFASAAANVMAAPSAVPESVEHDDPSTHIYAKLTLPHTQEYEVLAPHVSDTSTDGDAPDNAPGSQKGGASNYARLSFGTVAGTVVRGKRLAREMRKRSNSVGEEPTKMSDLLEEARNFESAELRRSSQVISVRRSRGNSSTSVLSSSPLSPERRTAAAAAVLSSPPPLPPRNSRGRQARMPLSRKRSISVPPPMPGVRGAGIRNLLQEPYYHPDVNRKTAEYLLLNEGGHNGLFLIRPSTLGATKLAISRCWKGRIFHDKIELVSPTVLRCEHLAPGEFFPSIEALVQYLKTNLRVADAHRLQNFVARNSVV
eukprot:m.103189 g.103189  ORF g.103189 m.103189 type:complete len:434 (-) comp9046_c2_seq2:153-1454(-)